jgi:hypothetical protein
VELSTNDVEEFLNSVKNPSEFEKFEKLCTKYEIEDIIEFNLDRVVHNRLVVPNQDDEESNESDVEQQKTF